MKIPLALASLVGAGLTPRQRARRSSREDSPPEVPAQRRPSETPRGAEPASSEEAPTRHRERRPQR
ncbi:hypothetical protein [Nocardioides sp.]|uniref:hypothetical protein n=1 Tax=Nocardioides sp. TaxID=35761 RepID=UPI003529903B